PPHGRGRGGPRPAVPDRRAGRRAAAGDGAVLRRRPRRPPVRGTRPVSVRAVAPDGPGRGPPPGRGRPAPVPAGGPAGRARGWLSPCPGTVRRARRARRP